MKIRFVNAGIVSGMRSQTIYHGLSYAQKTDTPDTLVMATPGTPYMCIGFFQDAENELNVEYCKETGGGAVYIDDGQLFVQWIFQKNSLPRRVDQRFQVFIEPLVETYKFFGIDAYYHPINDVHVGGRKIVGTGAGTIGDAEVVTGNFLFDFNYNTMIDAINVPTTGFRESVRRDLGQYLTTIQQELTNPPERSEIIEVYIQKCESILGDKIQIGEFTDDELRIMERLDEKFSTDKWLYQIDKSAPKDRLFKIHSGVWIAQTYHEMPAGLLSILSTMNGKVLETIEFGGDLIKQLPFDASVMAKNLTDLEIEFSVIKSAIDLFIKENNLVDNVIDSAAWSKAICEVRELQLVQTGHGTLARQSN